MNLTAQRIRRPADPAPIGELAKILWAISELPERDRIRAIYVSRKLRHLRDAAHETIDIALNDLAAAQIAEDVSPKVEIEAVKSMARLFTKHIKSEFEKDRAALMAELPEGVRAAVESALRQSQLNLMGKTKN